MLHLKITMCYCCNCCLVYFSSPQYFCYTFFPIQFIKSDDATIISVIDVGENWWPQNWVRHFCCWRLFWIVFFVMRKKLMFNILLRCLHLFIVTLEEVVSGKLLSSVDIWKWARECKIEGPLLLKIFQDHNFFKICLDI